MPTIKCNVPKVIGSRAQGPACASPTLIAGGHLRPPRMAKVLAFNRRMSGQMQEHFPAGRLLDQPKPIAFSFKCCLHKCVYLVTPPRYIPTSKVHFSPRQNYRHCLNTALNGTSALLFLSFSMEIALLFVSTT